MHHWLHRALEMRLANLRPSLMLSVSLIFVGTGQVLQQPLFEARPAAYSRAGELRQTILRLSGAWLRAFERSARDLI